MYCTLHQPCLLLFHGKKIKSSICYKAFTYKMWLTCVSCCENFVVHLFSDTAPLNRCHTFRQNLVKTKTMFSTTAVILRLQCLRFLYIKRDSHSQSATLVHLSCPTHRPPQSHHLSPPGCPSHHHQQCQKYRYTALLRKKDNTN